MICWLTLKAARPKLRRAMDEIEIKAFGIEVRPPEKGKKKNVFIKAV